LLCILSNIGVAAETIAIAGDSLAANFGSTTGIVGWGQISNGVMNANIDDFAVSGSSTKSFFYGSSVVDGIPAGQPNSIHRWANLLAARPDYIFVSFGWNDAFMYGDPELFCTVSDYRTNLRRMIDDARGIGAQPLLITSPTNRIFLSDGSVKNAIRPYADAMLAVAAEKSTPVIDLNSSLQNVYRMFGPNSAPIFGYNPRDYLHFGLYGATQAAHLIANEIPAALPSLDASLIPGGNRLELSNGGSTLALNPSYESTIDAPVLLEDNVIINGAGTVHFNGGISGARSLTVQAGNITASSINVDSLVIGTVGAQSVPEPSLSILLLGSFLFFVRKAKNA
jgi:lysophospholipase L1-like esterase